MKDKRCKLYLNHVSVSKVDMLLKNLKNSKSVSIDGLDNYSVKVSHKQICRPVHHLITLSLMQCKFPTSWRYSKLVPLHKKGSKIDCDSLTHILP